MEYIKHLKKLRKLTSKCSLGVWAVSMRKKSGGVFFCADLLVEFLGMIVLENNTSSVLGNNTILPSLSS